MINQSASMSASRMRRAVDCYRIPIMAVCLSVSALLTGHHAHAQVMLYENRLPDGYAYVRFANALPGNVTLKPEGVTDPLTLGAEGAARVSAYFLVENVAGRTFTAEFGGATPGLASFELKPGAFHTVLFEKTDSGVAARVVADQSELSQTKARLAFYNAIPDCAAAGLQLEPNGQSVFSGVGPNLMRGRSVNPAPNPRMRATCGSDRAVSLDLGPLDAGGQYSVWLMAPGGVPIAFLSKNSIAPYLR